MAGGEQQDRCGGEQTSERLRHSGLTHLSCGLRCPPYLNPQGRAFTQYDNSSRQLGTDVRIRWTFRSSGDFFVTYNHNIDVPLGSRPWTFDSNRLSTKLQYALRY